MSFACSARRTAPIPAPRGTTVGTAELETCTAPSVPVPRKTPVAHSFSRDCIGGGGIRSWKAFDADTGKDMAREIREYLVGDVSNWKDHDSFEKGFERLLRDLRAEGAKEKDDSAGDIPGVHADQGEDEAPLPLDPHLPSSLFRQRQEENSVAHGPKHKC